MAPSAGPTNKPSVQPTASTASGSPSAWHKVGPTTGLEGSQGLNVVGWFKDRWVVFGATLDGSAAWWSTNGADWHPADLRPAQVVRTLVHVTALASNGDVAVAVGSWNERSVGGFVDQSLAGMGPATISFALGTGEDPHVIPTATCEGLGSADAAVLTSVDGVTWTRVPDSQVLHGQPMFGVTVHDGVFVAAGGADGTGRSATWTSPDGRHWTRGADSPALRAGWIGDVADFGASVIAVGGSACGNEGSVPRAWRSGDGHSWALASGLTAGSCCGTAEHVAGGNGLAVSAGAVSAANGDMASVTWTSANGSSWTAHPQASQPDDLWIQRIAAGTGGFIGVGEGVWTSPDGVSWTQAASPDVSLAAVAVGPDGALAVGTDIWAGPAGAPSP